MKQQLRQFSLWLWFFTGVGKFCRLLNSEMRHQQRHSKRNTTWAAHWNAQRDGPAPGSATRIEGEWLTVSDARVTSRKSRAGAKPEDQEVSRFTLTQTSASPGSPESTVVAVEIRLQESLRSRELARGIVPSLAGIFRERTRITVFRHLNESEASRTKQDLGFMRGRWWWRSDHSGAPQPLQPANSARIRKKETGRAPHLKLQRADSLWVPGLSGRGAVRGNLSVLIALGALADRARKLDWCLGEVQLEDLGWVWAHAYPEPELVLLVPGPLHLRADNTFSACCTRGVELGVLEGLLRLVQHPGWREPLLEAFSGFLVREASDCDRGESLREVLELTFADLLSPAGAF